MPDLIPVVTGAIGVCVVAGVVHHLLSWMERRGWIFYRSSPTAPLGVRAANALMELDTLVNPAVEHVIEYRRYGDLWPQPDDGA